MTLDSVSLSDLGLTQGDSNSFSIGGQTVNWTTVLETSSYGAILGFASMVLFADRRRK